MKLYCRIIGAKPNMSTMNRIEYPNIDAHNDRQLIFDKPKLYIGKKDGFSANVAVKTG